MSFQISIFYKSFNHEFFHCFGSNFKLVVQQNTRNSFLFFFVVTVVNEESPL